MLALSSMIWPCCGSTIPFDSSPTSFPFAWPRRDHSSWANQLSSPDGVVYTKVTDIPSWHLKISSSEGMPMNCFMFEWIKAVRCHRKCNKCRCPSSTTPSVKECTDELDTWNTSPTYSSALGTRKGNRILARYVHILCLKWCQNRWISKRFYGECAKMWKAKTTTWNEQRLIDYWRAIAEVRWWSVRKSRGSSEELFHGASAVQKPTSRAFTPELANSESGSTKSSSSSRIP